MTVKHVEEQPMYQDFVEEFDFLAKLATRGGNHVSLDAIANYAVATGGMVKVLCVIVGELQEQNTLLVKRVAELMEYAVLRDGAAVRDADGLSAAMQEAAAKFDATDSTSRLQELARKHRENQ